MEWKRMERKDGKGGDSMGEKLSSLECPTNAYAYCSLQVRAFRTLGL